MPLSIVTLVLGPLQNNTYILGDAENHEAAVIDPSFDAESIQSELNKQGWMLSLLLITHAHFDHITAVKSLLDQSKSIPIGLHPADLDLWRKGGGADQFGIQLGSVPEPDVLLYDGKILRVGKYPLEVRHTPGHTRGHVIFFSPESEAAFCGDLIFQGSVGRTDLPGGDHTALLRSIQRQVLTLPPRTRLFPGHGPATTVAEENKTNPYLYERG